MIENADKVVNCIAEKIREILRTIEYGTFDIRLQCMRDNRLKYVSRTKSICSEDRETAW